MKKYKGFTCFRLYLPNGFTASTKVEEYIGTDDNVTEAKIDCPNSNASIIGMKLYLASNTRSDIYFDVNQCAWFTQYTKESHDPAVKRICQYLQGTKDNSMVFNPYNRMAMGCYVNAKCLGM